MKLIDRCEVCGGLDLSPVLNLGMHPLCDDLVPLGDDRMPTEYPIEILFCLNCKTGHQKYQVDKFQLFPKSYHYRSRFTQDVVKGMKELVDSVLEIKMDLNSKIVLDIGSNDGTLLDFFKSKGAITLGVEPTDAAIDSLEKGHYILQTYFDDSAVEQILSRVGKVDIITFTNVFAHIENLPSLITSLSKIMKPDSLLIIENHYLGSILSTKQFDTFYHEHPRTYSATSFLYIASSLGAHVSKIDFPKRYGGNIRVFITRTEIQQSLKLSPEIQAKEELFLNEFKLVSKAVEEWKISMRKRIDELVSKHGPLPAKAFPGRAAILVKLLGINESHVSAVYEKPGSMKIGNYVPGTRIPIKSEEILFQTEDFRPIINLAWHISDEISKYLEMKDYKGEVIDIISIS